MPTTIDPINIRKGAHISGNGTYRYSLTRSWNRLFDQGQGVCWVMLNPSTADAHHDDPTIRRCIRFAMDWGYPGIEVVNLYALRATNPAQLLTHPEPIGELNGEAIRNAMDRSSLVIAAWGANKATTIRPWLTDKVLTPGIYHPHDGPHCLGLTKHGAPRHPLYVRADTQPIRYQQAMDLHALALQTKDTKP